MTQNKQLIITIIGLLLTSSNSIAAPAVVPTTASAEKVTNSSNSNSGELQQIIDDFDKYVAAIPADIREEVRKYRTEVAKINNQKRDLYRRISQEAQRYLAKEQEYKKRIYDLKKNTANNVEDNKSDKDGSKSKSDLPK